MLHYYRNWSHVGSVHAGSMQSATGRDNLIKTTCFRVGRDIITILLMAPMLFYNKQRLV